MSRLFAFSLAVLAAVSAAFGQGTTTFSVPQGGTDSLDHDVGVEAILAPTGIIPRHVPTVPQAVVANYGANAEDFPVCMVLSEGYSDTVMVTGLESGQEDTIDFAYFTPNVSGRCTSQAWSVLPDDEDRRNDTAVGLYSVGIRDVGVEGIRDSVDPRFRLTNYGPGAQYVFARLIVDDTTDRVIYSSIQGIMVPSLDTVSLHVGHILPDVPCHVWCIIGPDDNPSNDTGYFFWPGWPPWIEIVAVNQPPPGGVVDTGDVYAECVILNHVGGEDSVPVAFDIDEWHDTTWVDSGIGHRTATATRPWHATPGRYTCRMSTPDDDTSFIFYVMDTIPHDVAVESIVVPRSQVPEGDTVHPSVLLANYGTEPEFVYVTFTIDDLTDALVYASIQGQTIPPGDTVTLKYAVAWVAEPAGRYLAKAWHGLVWDRDRSNDTFEVYFDVESPSDDVAVSAIYAPRSAIDSGVSIVPYCQVTNFGESTVYDLPVHFRLPGGYSWVTAVDELAPGASTGVLFPEWHVHLPPDDYEAVAWTVLDGDINPGNDTCHQPFSVQVRDIAVSEILWPRDTVPDSTLCHPSCAVSNLGTTTETFEVRFQVGLFVARETVVGMPGRTTDTVEFSDEWYSSPGVWLSRAEVVPDPADPNPGNNVMYDTFWVRGTIENDVEIVFVWYPLPGDTLFDTTQVEPRYEVQNFGANSETFWAFWKAADSTGMVYLDSVRVMHLPPGATREVVFPQTRFRPTGRHDAVCSLAVAGSRVVCYEFYVVYAVGVQEQKAIPREWFVRVRPNPFGGHTQCEFGLPNVSFVSATVYSASGQLVRELESAAFAPGRYSVAWDGRDDAGRLVGRGVYHLRFVAGDVRSTHKLVKLR